jgi:tetratricopeptide (TPR) repeat protein
MNGESATHWNVFFSSCFTDTDDVYLSIRERVRNEFNSADDRSVWMGEDFPVLAPKSPTAPVEKALFCVKGVDRCDAYVAVVIDKHGSGIELGPKKKTQASFLELELFEAAISRKPAFVFILKGHEPTGRMAALLDLLAPALPGLCREPLDEDEILRRVGEILKRTQRPWRSRLGRFAALGPVAHTRLSSSRHRPYRPGAELPKIQFLDGPYDPTIAAPSLGVVETLLTTVDTYADHQSRLAILWLALRELMGQRPSRASGDHLIHCWDMALGKWTSSAAWYGLHGFCLMGCLGAISSRSRIVREYSRPAPLPHGPFASEYYSIAKKVGDPRLGRIFLDLALEHIEVTLRDKEAAEPLAIRGSIYWQIGRGKESITDYERVVELRRDEGAPPQKIGEGMAELGFALARSRKTRSRGIELLERGVELGATGPVDGFFIRAKRKLGLGYLIAGSPRLALHELAEAHRLAAKHGMFDQIGRIERIAARVEQSLPGLSSRRRRRPEKRCRRR